MKRIISVLVSLALVITVFALPVYAGGYPDLFPNTHKNTGKNLADLIAVAKTQIGYTELDTSTGLPLSSSQSGGYTKYGAWFGSSTTAWCAFFVAWCSNQAKISTGVIPRIGNCAAMINWYTQKGRYFSAGELAPRTGDLVFYDWNSGSAKHVGIVTGVGNGCVYTIEGNTGGSQGYRVEAKTRTYSVGIMGFARPAYNDASTYVGSYSFAQYASSRYKLASSKGRVTKGSIITKKSKLAVVTSSAQDITDESAVLKGRIENSSSYAVTSSGFYFGEKKDGMKKFRTNSRSSKKTIELSYDISDGFGKLKTACTYYYCSYAVIKSKTYKGPVYTLVTADNRPKQLVLSESEINIDIGNTYELFYALLPLEAKNEGITWESSNPDVLSVENGIITGLSAGTAKITAKSVYGNAEAECNVTVKLPSAENLSTKNISESEILLTWSAPSVKGIEGYEIYRSQTMFGEYEAIGKTDLSKTEFSDPSVSRGKSYYYKILSFGTDEKYNSDFTAPKRETAKIPCPENLKLQRKGTAVRLSWSECKKAKVYCIYKADSLDGKYSLIGKTDVCNFLDRNIKVGEESWYKVSCESKYTSSVMSQCIGKFTAALPKPDTDFVTQSIFGEIDFSGKEKLRDKFEVFIPIDFYSLQRPKI